MEASSGRSYRLVSPTTDEKALPPADAKTSSHHALSAEKTEYKRDVLRQYGHILRRIANSSATEQAGKVSHSGVSEVTLPNIDELNRRYRRLLKIGEGSFGEVFIIYDTVAKTYLTMKRVFRLLHYGRSSMGLHHTIFRELQLLSTLSHPSIVPVVDYHLLLDGTLLMLMPLVAHDFSYLMRGHMRIGEHRQRMPIPVIKCLFRQILSAVAYMHKHKVIHRDLKPSNIMVDHDGTVKLIDFGWSRYMAASNGGKMTGPPCTVVYRPPEVLIGGSCVQHYNCAIDIWCCGCILFEMLTGGTRFVNARTEVEALDGIIDWLGSPSSSSVVYNEDRRRANSARASTRALTIPKGRPSTLAPRCAGLNISSVDVTFMSLLLCLEPGQRKAAHDLLEHPWFTTPPAACAPGDIALPSHNAYRLLESRRGAGGE